MTQTRAVNKKIHVSFSIRNRLIRVAGVTYGSHRPAHSPSHSVQVSLTTRHQKILVNSDSTLSSSVPGVGTQLMNLLKAFMAQALKCQAAAVQTLQSLRPCVYYGKGRWCWNLKGLGVMEFSKLQMNVSQGLSIGWGHWGLSEESPFSRLIASTIFLFLHSQ